MSRRTIQARCRRAVLKSAVAEALETRRLLAAPHVTQPPQLSVVPPPGEWRWQLSYSFDEPVTTRPDALTIQPLSGFQSESMGSTFVNDPGGSGSQHAFQIDRFLEDFPDNYEVTLHAGGVLSAAG